MQFTLTLAVAACWLLCSGCMGAPECQDGRLIRYNNLMIEPVIIWEIQGGNNLEEIFSLKEKTSQWMALAMRKHGLRYIIQSKEEDLNKLLLGEINDGEISDVQLEGKWLPQVHTEADAKFYVETVTTFANFPPVVTNGNVVDLPLSSSAGDTLVGLIKVARNPEVMGHGAYVVRWVFIFSNRGPQKPLTMTQLRKHFAHISVFTLQNNEAAVSWMNALGQNTVNERLFADVLNFESLSSIRISDVETQKTFLTQLDKSLCVLLKEPGLVSLMDVQEAGNQATSEDIIGPAVSGMRVAMAAGAVAAGVGVIGSAIYLCCVPRSVEGSSRRNSAQSAGQDRLSVVESIDVGGICDPEQFFD